MSAPSQIIETVKIVSDETESGYMIINVADFDPEFDEEYVAPALVQGEPLELTDEERAALPPLGAVEANEPNVLGEGLAPEAPAAEPVSAVESEQPQS